MLPSDTSLSVGRRSRLALADPPSARNASRSAGEGANARMLIDDEDEKSVSTSGAMIWGMARPGGFATTGSKDAVLDAGADCGGKSEGRDIFVSRNTLASGLRPLRSFGSTEFQRRCAVLALSSPSGACACVLSLGTDSGSEIVRLGAGGIGRGPSPVSLAKRRLTTWGSGRTSKGSSLSTPSKLGLVMDVGEVENAEGCSTGGGSERCARQLGSMTSSVSDWNDRDISSTLRLLSSELIRLNGMRDVLRGEIASPPGRLLSASVSAKGEKRVETVETVKRGAED